VFDLQISPEDRPAVLAIVNRAFAGASVGYVPSVEHLTAARSMRMVAKWLAHSAPEIDEAVRIAGRFHGASLRELAETNKAFGALYRRSPGFRDVVAHAASVEGLPFGFTRAKRTVIVSPRPLRDFFAYTVSPTTGDHFVQATRQLRTMKSWHCPHTYRTYRAWTGCSTAYWISALSSTVKRHRNRQRATCAPHLRSRCPGQQYLVPAATWLHQRTWG